MQGLCSLLIGTNEDRIVSEVQALLHDAEHYDLMARAVNPYGDGLAAHRTLAAIHALFGSWDRLPDFDPTVPQLAVKSGTNG